MLIDDGILSLDETLGDVFLNKRCIDGVLWNKVDQADFVQEVTIEEMLTMTSGLLNPNIDPDEVDWTDPYVQANHGDANLTHTLNYLDASGEKGEFHYVLTSQILGYVIKERSGLTPRQFAKERIFPLLGISDDEIKWKENHDGLQQSFSGLHLNQEQMSKFGQLYLQKGLAGGDDASRIVSERWVEESTSPKIGAGFPGLSMGYLLWPFDGSKLGFSMVGEFYCAQGLGTQIICVHDELQRVFVMQVDLENGQPGLSETALIAFGLVAFNSATSFDGGDAASSEADAVAVAGEIAAGVLAELGVVPKTEGEDTSSSAGICSRQKHVMIASALLASVITGIIGS